jgi:oligopeptide/dipeptide ABC transporter ATP-binding protein
MGSIPRLDRRVDRLAVIPGAVPAPAAWGPACRFADRCPLAIARCRAERPALRPVAAGHLVACHRAPIEARVAA